MSERPDFQAFQSIPRLKRGCVISEKIDGTNAQVWISEDLSLVCAGSRNRWLTVEDDNFGFAKWVADHADELRALGPGHHFGEWWRSGIQRRYGMEEKRFSLFNAGRWGAENPQPACCHVVPVLYGGPFSTDIDAGTLAKLAVEGSAAAPGFMQPEGIVIYLTSARTLFKVTIGDDGHKGTK